ncbi:MAG TPA: hypothetical protein VIR57_11445 [Chloroflexota bacterium]
MIKAGTPPIILMATATVQGDKITSWLQVFDISDPATLKFVQAQASAPAASAAAKPAASGAAAAGSAAAKPAATGAPAPSGVTLTLVSPKDGSSVPAGDVTVNYDVTGVTLVPAADAKQLTDYHAHVLLDTDPAPYVVQFLPAPTGNDKIVHTAAKTVTFKSVPAGSHTLAIYISTSNHISVGPPIQTKATFTVQQG